MYSIRSGHDSVGFDRWAYPISLGGHTVFVYKYYKYNECNRYNDGHGLLCHGAKETKISQTGYEKS